MMTVIRAMHDFRDLWGETVGFAHALRKVIVGTKLWYSLAIPFEVGKASVGCMRPAREPCLHAVEAQVPYRIQVRKNLQGSIGGQSRSAQCLAQQL